VLSACCCCRCLLACLCCQGLCTAATFIVGAPAGLHGCSVIITGRRKEVLDEAVSTLRSLGIEAAGLQGDVRNPDACQDWVNTTVKMFGQLNILVNCAAGNFLANAAELSQGGFRTGEQCLSRRQQCLCSNA
jgi:NAD(P)-dependent dehydrogenase (short-subunit alcohol dehydrogenase family)